MMKSPVSHAKFGIAAAFYFSIRSGNRRDKRLRSAGAGRAGASRGPGGRTSTARPDLTRADLNGHPRRAANGSGPVTTFRPAASPKTYRPKADTGPDPVADFDHVPAGDHRAAPGAAVTRGGSGRTGTRAAEPVAARRAGDRQAPPEDSWPGDAEAAIRVYRAGTEPFHGDVGHWKGELCIHAYGSASTASTNATEAGFSVPWQLLRRRSRVHVFRFISRFAGGLLRRAFSFPRGECPWLLLVAAVLVRRRIIITGPIDVAAEALPAT